jgi:hypothetical protein
MPAVLDGETEREPVRPAGISEIVAGGDVLDDIVVGGDGPDHLADIRVLKGGVSLFRRLVPVVPTHVRPGEN